jgi:hypothetical protein
VLRNNNPVEGAAARSPSDIIQVGKHQLMMDFEEVPENSEAGFRERQISADNTGGFLVRPDEQLQLFSVVARAIALVPTLDGLLERLLGIVQTAFPRQY